MALVGYSDSEASSEGEKPKVASKTATKPGKQKVVDSSNPKKIRVTLPESSKNETEASDSIDVRPAKRTKVGGGMSGFNAMLPAPKRPAASASSNGTSRGLGRGVNLKTGAAPGFTREPMSEPTTNEGKEDNSNEEQKEERGTQPAETEVPVTASSVTKVEPIKKGNPMMFKPLSVARNPKKKKPITAVASQTSSTKAETEQSATSEVPSASKAKPAKVSLFPMGASEPAAKPAEETSVDYQPMMYQPETAGPISEEATQDSSSASIPSQPNGTLSLDSIASDLNLSASARRQLFGRGGSEASVINVTNFNTDAEWRHNEAIRASGEQQQAINPVRYIAPGKHSLKALVSNASDQREALEQSFASGKATKKEAGSRYGW